MAQKRRWIHFSVRDCSLFFLEDVAAQSRMGKWRGQLMQKCPWKRPFSWKEEEASEKTNIPTFSPSSAPLADPAGC
jgi:hypothetical protein